MSVYFVHRRPSRANGILHKPETNFFGTTIALLHIALDASNNAVVPGSPTTAATRNNVVNRGNARSYWLGAILASPIVATKKILAA